MTKESLSLATYTFVYKEVFSKKFPHSHFHTLLVYSEKLQLLVEVTNFLQTTGSTVHFLNLMSCKFKGAFELHIKQNMYGREHVPSFSGNFFYNLMHKCRWSNRYTVNKAFFVF